jgi:serine phosphatase RsbU (regulator of sigma subunit)
MALRDLLRLAEASLGGQASQQIAEDLIRALVETTSSRAGVLRRAGEPVARWPLTVSPQVEGATEGWSEIPVETGAMQWQIRLLQMERLDDNALDVSRVVLSAYQLQEELKRARFDERFHLWELEAIRSIATNIGSLDDAGALGDELIAHLVALLGVRSAHLYLGEDCGEVGGFGPRVLTEDQVRSARDHAVYEDRYIALPLSSDHGSLGVLVVADKEARAGVEPFASPDIRLLELFALQVTVALEYARLSRESLERDRMRRELEVAATIQGHLLPQSAPEVPGYRIAARSTPSRHVAGDTYDTVVDGDILVVTVTDVSGKGVGAGLIASGVHAGVRLLIGEGHSPRGLATRLNDYLCGTTEDNRFATFVLTRLHGDGTLECVNAGHCPVMVRRTDGSVQRLTSSGLPLGILGRGGYRMDSITLAPGDLVFLYTDGITEAENPAEEEFGDDRVEEVISRDPFTGADAACSAVLEAVDRFTEGVPLADDVTLVVVERL